MAVRPPDGRPPAVCTRLHRVLPDELDGLGRRDTTPASPATAAWGAPAVRLRCGVDRPAGLTPTSEVIEVNDVEWFLQERPAAYVFTTVHLRTYVQVRVPASTPRPAATGPLVGLAAPIRSTVPGQP